MSAQRKRVLREESVGNVYVQGLIPRLWRAASLISRRRRETVRSSRANEKRVSLLCDNSEPRSPETTGALMFGWPPKEALHYKLKLASHIRAAIVQCFAETQMATKPVVLHQRFCCNCGEAFYICKSCDRGHCYCGKTCSYEARLIKCRGYNRKDRESVEGQRDYADRQGEYRRRQKEITDHGSIHVGSSGIVRVREEIRSRNSMVHSMKTKIDSVRYAKCCICGRRGRWMDVEASPPDL